jgi:hypothetical protein
VCRSLVGVARYVVHQCEVAGARPRNTRKR